MANSKSDPSLPIRKKAARYPDVVEGTSCTQTAYRVGKTAFLYIGMQGGRYKAMFKLNDSKSEAARLAKAEPDRFQVGSTAWVTARFTAEEPLPKATWEKWLEESYQLSNKPKKKKTSTKKASTTKGARRATK